MRWSTYSSTEWERTGELLPSIAGVAKALTGVEASERREVEAPFERSGRRFLSIVVYVAIGADMCIGRSIARGQLAQVKPIGAATLVNAAKWHPRPPLTTSTL
jgi:hypothetical protein